MTGWPTLIVECAFATVPSSLTPTWTDITAYVRQVEGLGWSHGRPDQYSTTQPGRLALVLNNIDGRFTAGNVTSAYYPNVKLGRRLRVRETYNAVTYSRYDGYVNEWPTVWPAGGTLALAQITCTDRFGRFGRFRDLRSLLQEEVLYDNPTGYWTLGEPEGSTAAGDISGNQAPPLAVTRAGAGGTLTFGSGIGPPTDGMSAVMTARASLYAGEYLLTPNMALPVVGGAVSVECWFVATATQGTILTAVLGDGVSTVRLGIGGGVPDKLAGVVAQGGSASESPAAVVNNGLHHAVYTAVIGAVNTTGRLYLDGVEVDSDTYASTVPVPTTIKAVAVGAIPSVGGSIVSDLFTGTVAQADVYSGALSAARVTAHYTAGQTAFAGELTDARIGRLARFMDLTDAALFALDVGVSPIAAQSFTDGNPLALMQEATAAEDGQLFMDGAGKLVLHSRSRRNTTTSAFTLQAQTGVVDTTFTTDDQFLVNDATYTRPGGLPQRAVYTYPTPGDYDTYADEQTFALTTDNAVLDRANWRVNTTSTPAPRCSQVTVNMLAQTDNALIAALLNADVSTRFTIAGLPSQAPAASVVLIIEGVSETVSGTEWSLTFNTSPAPAVRMFILNSSLLNSATDVLGY